MIELLFYHVKAAQEFYTHITTDLILNVAIRGNNKFRKEI